jgi:outer membrane protein OmpA-like peptidoglycan-associated protein
MKRRTISSIFWKCFRGRGRNSVGNRLLARAAQQDSMVTEPFGWVGVGALLIAGSAAFAQQQMSFVACPIVRDTKTVPCYLAEYGGETYFLGTQQDTGSSLPQLKHEVLVEGTAVPGPRVCGGVPLRPVAISVMKEVNLACNTLLPAEPGIEAPPASPQAAEARPAKVLPGQWNFVVQFAFDDDHIDARAEHMITEAADIAKQTHAGNVKVTGYRAASLLSNGETMTEKAGIAEKRAQSIAALLRGLGVPAVTVEWKSEAEPGDGKSDPMRRRVTIAMTP